MLVADCSDGVPAFWDNDTLPWYLDALAEWLNDHGGDYTTEGARTRWSSWEVIAKAMQAATTYE